MRTTILLISAALPAGCSRQDEKPNASVEIKVNDDRTSLEKSLDETGRDLKKGAKEAQSKLEDAGDELKEKFEQAKDKLSDDKKAEVKVEVKK